MPLFETSWGAGVLNSAIFNILHTRVEFGTILEGLQNFGGGTPPNPPSTVRHWRLLPASWPSARTSLRSIYV